MNEWLRSLLGLFVMLQGPALMASYNQGYIHILSRDATGVVGFLLILIGYGILRGWASRHPGSVEG